MLILVLTLGVVRQCHPHQVAVIIVLILNEATVSGKRFVNAAIEIVLEYEGVAIRHVDAIQLPVVIRRRVGAIVKERIVDRKSTRLNSSHLGISYAVFCL